MARKKGSRDYPIKTKREAVRLAHEEGWTYTEVAAHLGIRSTKTIRNWMWRYRKEGEIFFEMRKKGRPVKKTDTDAYIAKLEMQVELLKKYRTELCQGSLAKRNIGQLNTTEEDTK